MRRQQPSPAFALAAVLLSVSAPLHVQAAYSLQTLHQGASFFDGWNFWGNRDNLTNGASRRILQGDFGLTDGGLLPTRCGVLRRRERRRKKVGRIPERGGQRRPQSRQLVVSSRPRARFHRGDLLLAYALRNSSLAYGGLRNSVRITTDAAYDIGSLFVMDAYHVPFGVRRCGPELEYNLQNH